MAVRGTMAAARGAMEWVARWQQAHMPPQFRAANLSVPRSPQTIPQIILQVGATAESALKKHEKWMRTWWTLNPEYDYMLLSDEDCDAFVGAHASDDERRAYGVLRTGAQRADLFRVLWLKLVGGVYADLDLELRMPLRQAFDRAAGLDYSSRATNYREWAALPPDNRTEASLVTWDFSGWNFAFLAYERDHPLLVSVTRSIVELVLGQWDAMRGVTNRTVCSSAVSCVLRVTGPSAYSSLVTTAARGLNCTNSWLPRARDCRQSESMRRIRVLVDPKGQVLTHWTCKRIISQRKCDIEHYTRQPRNASAFFLREPRRLPQCADTNSS